MLYYDSFTLPIDWLSELKTLGIIYDMINDVFSFPKVIWSECCQSAESKARFVFMSHIGDKWINI